MKSGEKYNKPKNNLNSKPKKIPILIKNASSVNILLVEDNPVNKVVGVGIIKKFGYNVKAANNGKEALSELKDNNFDLILMDCQMPLMDGFEATRKVRMLDGPKKNIPIIALTANSLKGAKEEYLDAGMDDFILKPFNYDDLGIIFVKYLNKKVDKINQGSK